MAVPVVLCAAAGGLEGPFLGVLGARALVGPALIHRADRCCDCLLAQQCLHQVMGGLNRCTQLSADGS